METDEVVKLLREIRDLQKLHVDNYRDALENQRISIAAQERAARFQRISLAVLALIVTVAVVALIFLPTHSVPN